MMHGNISINPVAAPSCETTPAIAFVFVGMFIGFVVDVALTLTEKAAQVLAYWRNR